MINLDSEQSVLEFLETAPKTYPKSDFEGGLLATNQTMIDTGRMDTLVSEAGFNTRVVAFFYDKTEYKEEIKQLKRTAAYLAQRFNLRIGIVTDQKLVNRMHASHNYLFPEFSKSVMVLRRYDGAIEKLDLSDSQTGDYAFWISHKSTKLVD